MSQAKLRVEQLREQHKDLTDQVRLDVQNAYLRVKETADRIRVTEKAVTQGEENLRLNEERYKEAGGHRHRRHRCRDPAHPDPGQLFHRPLRPPDGQGPIDVGRRGHQRPSPPGNRPTMLRKTSVRLGLVLLVLLLIGAGVGYWIYIHIFVSTDDAYVSGYVGVISARVPGRVAQVLVDDNQQVRAGQVLVILEPQDYEAAVAQAEGNLGRLRQEWDEKYVKVATAQTKVTQAEANFKLARPRPAPLYRLVRAPHHPQADPGQGGHPLPGERSRGAQGPAEAAGGPGRHRRRPPASPWKSSRPSRRPRRSWSRPASTWPIPG